MQCGRRRMVVSNLWQALILTLHRKSSNDLKSSEVGTGIRLAQLWTLFQLQRSSSDCCFSGSLKSTKKMKFFLCGQKNSRTVEEYYTKLPRSQ